MRVTLNPEAFEHAKRLIADARYVADEAAASRAHRPPVELENEWLLERGDEAYTLWHLGVDHDEHHDPKAKYVYAYGDFEDVHRCALADVARRARAASHVEIEQAARELERLIDDRAA